jgi:hypothetical protein
MAIWILTAVLIALPHLVEVILVELSDKTGKVAVFEMLGKD